MAPRDVQTEQTTAIDGTPLQVQTATWTDDNAAPLASQGGDGGTGVALDLLLTHANGFCKETLTPLVSELNARLPAGVLERTVSFDFRGMGQSGRMNQHTREMLDKDPGLIWTLGKEDVKAVCDTGLLHRSPQQGQKRLVVGMGHSAGGTALVRAALDHPYEEVPLDALVLYEPIISLQDEKDFAELGHAPEGATIGGEAMTKQTLRRKNGWPSKAEAEAKLGGKPPYSLWDPRCLEGFMAGAFRAQEQKEEEKKEEPRVIAGLGGAGPSSSLGFNAAPVAGAVQTDPLVAAAALAESAGAVASLALDGSPQSGPVELACAPDLEVFMYGYCQPPFASRLPQLGGTQRRVPVLILVGENNIFDQNRAGFGLAPLGKQGPFGEELQRRFRRGGDDEDGAAGPIVDLVTMPKLSHLGPMERPDQLAAVIAKWVENRVLPMTRQGEEKEGSLPRARL